MQVQPFQDSCKDLTGGTRPVGYGVGGLIIYIPIGRIEKDILHAVVVLSNVTAGEVPVETKSGHVGPIC